MKFEDFPKLESVFERETKNGKYVVTPKLKEEYRWILDKDKVIASEKFDGTNCSVYIEDGEIKAVLNRTNRINIWKSNKMFYEGIKRAIDEGKLKPGRLKDGQYFGELIGERINGNPHKITGHLYLPLYWIREHYLFKFYYGWLEEEIREGMSDEEIFEKFSELMYNLWSLWFRKFKEKRRPEGIVFYNRETGEQCKIRVDMFSWLERTKFKKLEDEN